MNRLDRYQKPIFRGCQKSGGRGSYPWDLQEINQLAARQALANDRYRLDATALSPHAGGVSRPDGRSCYGRKAAGEESPGSIDIRCRITSGGGNPRDSATENEPLPPPFPPPLAGEGSREGAVRVKRCGKSAPRVRQRKRHGKPHREQDRIGTATRIVRRKAITPQGDVRLAVRVGCSRQRANVVPEEWPSRIAGASRRCPTKPGLQAG